MTFEGICGRHDKQEFIKGEPRGGAAEGQLKVDQQNAKRFAFASSDHVTK
jgi:hypothetical protein